MKPFCISLLALCVMLSATLSAQELCAVAYYDLDGLYDTVPSPFGGDGDYTPRGPKRWSGERYRKAVERHAALLDSLALPLIALFGVENEAVALDLAAHSQGDYAVLHRTSSRRDGLDFALLYQADYFLPGAVWSDYGLLLVEGELQGRKLRLLLCNDDDSLAECLERMALRGELETLILLGAVGRAGEGHPLKDPLRKAERAGRGTRLKGGAWQMRDRILLGAAWEPVKADVYAREWLLDSRTGAPLPLYSRDRYRGGRSRNLPLFLYFRPANLEN